MVTSYANRTSVVLRGNYILENIIGTPPSPPPPNVPAFKENKEGEKPHTVRETMELHRANPTCNACHGIIDPLGFALENFDTVGAWRDKDRYTRTAIDASGKLVDGTVVNGPDDLRKALMSRPDQFVETMTEKFLSYALGRSLTAYDMPTVRKIVRDAARDNYRFSSHRDGNRRERAVPDGKSAGGGAQPGAGCLGEAVGNFRRRSNVHHQETSRAPHVPARHGRHHGSAAAGCHDSGAHRSGADRGHSHASHGIHLLPAWRHHGALDAEDGRNHLRSSHHSEAAGAFPEAADGGQRPGKQARHQPGGARHHARNLAELRASAREPGSLSAGRPSTRSPPRTSARTRRCRRSKSPSKAAEAAAPAIATLAAATRAPFRSARPPRRFPWRPSRARFSRVCSARAILRTERKILGKQYASILDLVSTEATDLQRTLGPQDRAMLSDYLDTVREIERRIQKMEAHDLSHVDIPECARRNAAAVRTARRTDVRSAGAGLSGQYDARLQHDDGGRGEQSDLQPDRRSRRVPSAVASQQRAGEDGPAGEDPDLSHRAFREVPGQAADRCRTATAPCWTTP